MTDVFEQAFACVIGSEGGFSSVASDPGNWTGGACGKGTLRGTNWGISAAAYPSLDIQALTQSDAQAIYRRDYWDRFGGDQLPAPLALLVFDASVNNGVSRAARWLQQAIGTTVDGSIGAETLAALTQSVARDGGAAICTEFQALRLIFMAGLPTWSTFSGGWARRLCRLPYQSMQMTAIHSGSA
jgi:lysozyme family protein